MRHFLAQVLTFKDKRNDSRTQFDGLSLQLITDVAITLLKLCVSCSDWGECCSPAGIFPTRLENSKPPVKFSYVPWRTAALSRQQDTNTNCASDSTIERSANGWKRGRPIISLLHLLWMMRQTTDLLLQPRNLFLQQWNHQAPKRQADDILYLTVKFVWCCQTSLQARR